MKKRSIFFLIVFIAISFKINSQTQFQPDSLIGFDSSAAKQYIVQNNLNSFEQTLYLSKKKRDYKNLKYNLVTPIPPALSVSKIISSNNSVMSGNLDFEAGNLSGWNIATSQNLNSVPTQSCCANSTVLAVALNGGADPYFGFNLTSPLGGNYIARLNSTTNKGYTITTISNTIPVNASSNLLKIAGKYVFEMAQHNCNQQPYVNIKVTDLSGTTVIFSKFIQANEAGMGGFCSGINLNGQIYTNNTSTYFTNAYWDVLCIDLSSLMGSTAVVEITVSECSQGGHGGYAYFDLLNTGFTPANNTISINNTTYSITSQPFNIGVCNSNTAAAIAPATALSYTWFGTGINGATTPSVQINQAGNYTLVSTMPNNSGCGNATNNSTVQFTVGSSAAITANASPTLICGTAPVNFTLFGASNYSISSTYGYNTIFSGYNISIIPPVSCSYFITGLNYSGCSATKTINVQVSPQPTLSISGNNFCAGNTGTITVAGADTYTWVQGTTTVSTSNQLVLTPTNSAFYTITGTNTITGCTNSYGFYSQVSFNTLSVSPLPTICMGNSIALTASGSAGTYTWNLGSSTTTNIAITVNPITTTTYTLSSNNACGNIVTPITVTVNPLPVLAVSGPTALCPGKSYTWTATGADYYVFSGLTFYAGIYPTIATTISTSSTPYINLAGTDVNGCQSTSTLNLTVLSSPFLSLSNTLPLNICTGNSITLNGQGASTYTWNTGSNLNSINVSPTITTCYSFTGTAANGCESSINNCVTVNPTPTLAVTLSPSTGSICPPPTASSAFLNVSGASTYTWMPGSMVSSSPIVQPTVSTNYTVTGSDVNGCTSSATQFLFVYPSPILNINSPSALCSGNSACFTTSGDVVAFNWNGPCGDASGSPNPCLMANTGCGHTYSVGGTNVNGCLIITSFSISINPSPTISVNSGTICAGQIFTLNPSGALTYTYSSGSSTVSPAFTTSYTVDGTDVNGCQSQASAVSNITVNNLPTVNIASNASLICVGQQATLTANGANTYLWNTASTNTTIVISPTVNTTYTVTGTDINNCQNIATVTQNVSLCTANGALNGNEAQQFFIYPNPSKNIFNIECDCAGDKNSIEIYNSLGQLIFEQKAISPSFKVDLSEYSAGLYSLKIKAGNETVVKRIIKE